MSTVRPLSCLHRPKLKTYTVLRDAAEGCNKQHDNPAGKIHDTPAGDSGAIISTHNVRTHDSIERVRDGESNAVHAQQATSHNSNQFSINHT